jgi:hypothetical protein
MMSNEIDGWTGRTLNGPANEPKRNSPPRVSTAGSPLSAAPNRQLESVALMPGVQRPHVVDGGPNRPRTRRRCRPCRRPRPTTRRRCAIPWGRPSSFACCSLSFGRPGRGRVSRPAVGARRIVVGRDHPELRRAACRQVGERRPAELDPPHEAGVRRGRIRHPPHARLVLVEAHGTRHHRVGRAPAHRRRGKARGNRGRRGQRQPDATRAAVTMVRRMISTVVLIVRLPPRLGGVPARGSSRGFDWPPANVCGARRMHRSASSRDACGTHPRRNRAPRRR